MASTTSPLLRSRDGNLYCLERQEWPRGLQISLRGENVIAFHCIELVSGSADPDHHVAQNKKIVVIDDPISSLSNTFVYDVAWLIANEIIAGKTAVRQVLVLTHSLFFHHELIKQIKQTGQCQYFRVVKRQNTIVADGEERYQERIRRGLGSHQGCARQQRNYTVGVANAMRCIFEQFFTFTSQQGAFKKALQDMENDDRRFVPLSRYLDNQSHRNDQNLIDFGDHDVQFFLDKLKAVFDATHYPHHYASRMGLPIQTA